MTNKLLFDAELAWKVYDHIEAHPEEWNQYFWTALTGETMHIKCGTKACYAGTIAFMRAPQNTIFGEYYVILPTEDGEGDTKPYPEYAINLLTKGTADLKAVSLTPTTDEYNAACDLRYGIKDMFAATNSLEYIKSKIEQLAANYPSI